MIRQSPDCYSASTLRDLVFHVQEHQFTLPEIRALLDKYGLEFLGFSFGSPRYNAAYAKTFPDDRRCINLENWGAFKGIQNAIFARMYKFWCRKKDGVL
jgi:hypothetical protein